MIRGMSLHRSTATWSAAAAVDAVEHRVLKKGMELFVRCMIKDLSRMKWIWFESSSMYNLSKVHVTLTSMRGPRYSTRTGTGRKSGVRERVTRRRWYAAKKMTPSPSRSHARTPIWQTPQSRRSAPWASRAGGVPTPIFPALPPRTRDEFCRNGRARP